MLMASNLQVVIQKSAGSIPADGFLLLQPVATMEIFLQSMELLPTCLMTITLIMVLLEAMVMILLTYNGTTLIDQYGSPGSGWDRFRLGI